MLRSAVREARDDDVPMMAQALAYALFLAIPATALVVLGVFSLVADPESVTRVVDAARDVMPAEAAALLEDSLRRSTQSAGGGLLMTIVGFVLAVWSTTSAAATLMNGLTRAYDADDERSFVRKRLVALLIVCALVVGAALVVVFLVLGPHLERWLGSTLEAESLTAWAWWTLQWPILLGALLFAFATVLSLGPGVEQHTWKLISPGALTAVLIWLVASGGFAFYTASFGSYNKSWGALSAVVITLVWLWLTSASLLFGAEINAEAERLRGKTESEAAVL
ncbi:MAG TPA: YihY/virulence factor BrkB family protein [Gaiellaceae bacterium]|nr:YihY/virulence factor BrkB family protein [Gaiellaceae bacterium]